MFTVSVYVLIYLYNYPDYLKWFHLGWIQWINYEILNYIHIFILYNILNKFVYFICVDIKSIIIENVWKLKQKL